MKYKSVPLKELQALGQELEKVYTNTNPQRFSFLALYDLANRTVLDFPPKSIAKVLMGLAIFELEQADSECYFTPKSTIYHQIRTKLGITDTNQLNDDERIYYLNKFYRFAQKMLTDESIIELKNGINNITRARADLKNRHISPVWSSKKDLLKNIHARLKSVRKREAVRISQLVHATPELIALRKNTQTIPTHYKLARANRWSWLQSGDREPMIRLISFLDDSFYHFYPEAEVNKLARLQEDESNARRGLILFSLMDIESNYRFLSPEGGWFNRGSDLFKENVKVLNVENLKHLSYEQKIKWLNALSEHINDIKNDINYFTAQKLEWQNKKWNDLEKELNKYQVAIIKFRTAQEIEKNELSTPVSAVTTITSATATWALDHLIKKGLVVGAGAVATGLGGPMGLAIYAGSTLLVSGLFTLVSKGLISSATAYLYAWMLERLGSKVGETAGNMISYRFLASDTKEGIDQVRRQLNPEDEREFVRWVNTLIELPDDIISVEDKKRIRLVFGLNENEKLKSLNPKSIEEKQKEQELLLTGFICKKEKSESLIKDDYTPLPQVGIFSKSSGKTLFVIKEEYKPQEKKTNGL